MADPRILEMVKSGDWKHLREDVNVRLTQLSKRERFSDILKLNKSLVATVASTIAKLKSKSQDEISDLIETALFSHEYSVNTRKQLPVTPDPDIQYAKSMYHILNYLADQGHRNYSLLVKTSDYLTEELRAFCQENVVANEQALLTALVHNSYVLLWNTAPAIDSNQTDDKSYLKSLILREKAVNCLIVNPENFIKYCQQAILAARFCCKHCGGSRCQPLENFYRDTFRSICQHFFDSKQDPQSVRAVTLFVEGWVNYLLTRESVQRSAALAVIDQIRSLTNYGKKLAADVETVWSFYVDAVTLAIVFYPFDGNEKNLTDSKISHLISSCSRFLQCNPCSDFNDIIYQSLQPLSRCISISSTSEVLRKRLENKFYSRLSELEHLLSAFVKWGITNGMRKDESNLYMMCFEDLMTLCAFYLNNQLQLSNDLSSDIETNLSNIISLTQIYGSAVDENLPKSKTSIETFVIKVWNIAMSLYNKVLFKEACRLLDLCMEHLIKLSAQDSQHFSNIDITRKIRVYASTLCKCQRFEDALRFIAKILAVGYKDLKGAATQWATIKCFANGTSGSENISKMTTVDLLSNYVTDEVKIDTKSLLNFEISAYKERSATYRYDARTATFSALEKLLGLCTDDFEKAVVYIKMAKCLLDNPGCSTSNPADLCAKAVQLLTRNQKYRKSPSIADCYLAQAYFCRHLMKANTLQNMATHAVELSVKDMAEKKAAYSSRSQEYSEERNRGNDLIPNYDHTTLEINLEDAKDLDSVVDIWSSVISSKTTIPFEDDCLDDLIALAEIYSKLRLTTNEFRVWMLAYRVAERETMWSKFCYVSCRIIYILIQCGLTDRAAVYMSILKSHLLEIEDIALDVKVFALLCESELLLMQNKILNGWSILKVALERLSATPETVFLRVLKIEAKLLESKYCELPFSLLPLSERPNCTTIDLANKGMRMALSLIKQNHFIPRVLNGLFNCALQLGKLYLGIGAPREARCFLKEQLIWACKLSLANRAAELLLLLAKLDVMSGDFNSCQVKINAVNYILDSEGTRLLSAVTASGQSAARSEELNISAELDLQSCELDNSIYSRSAMDSSQASPVLQNAYDCLKHPFNCKCSKCHHMIFHRLCLELSCLQAECYYLQEEYKATASTMLREKLNEIESLYSINKSLVSKILILSYADVSPPHENKLKTCLKSDKLHWSLQFIKFEISCKLAVMSLKECRFDEAHLIVKDAFQKANKITFIGLQQTHVTIATLKYLYCVIKIILRAKKEKMKPTELFNEIWAVTSIPLFNVESDPDIEFLEAKTSQIRLTDDLVNSFKTPLPKRQRGKVMGSCKAPLKRMPILSIRPNQFDDDLQELEGEGALQPQESIYEDNTDENSSPEKKDNSAKNTEIVRRSQRRAIKIPKLPLRMITDVDDSNIVVDTQKVNNEYKNKPVVNQSKKPTSFTGAKYIALLESAINSIAHHPSYPLYSDIHVLLALCKGQQPNSKALHLLESVGVTLRYQGILTSSLQIKKPSGMSDFNQARQEILTFNKSFGGYEERMDEFCSKLPKDCVVCQINTVPVVFSDSNQRCNAELLITRLQKGRPPVVIKAYNNDMSNVNDLLTEFHNIFQDHELGSRLTVRQEWQKKRFSINDRIKVFLQSMEDVWLGYWKGLLLGSPAHEEDRKRLNDIVAKLMTKSSKLGFMNINRHLLELVVDSVPWLNWSQLRQALAVVFNIAINDARLHEFSEYVKHQTKLLCSKTLTRQLVVLVLNKEIHSLPWENIPILAGNAVTRMPSIYYIISHSTRNQNPKPIDTSRSFYVLNPGDDIPSTQKRFQSYFESLKWPGVLGRRPAKEEWSNALATKDLFVYCGHGNGIQFFSGDSIRNQECRASALLIGCSSVKLDTVNCFEPSGAVLNYLIAGSPCILGTLWNVTDVEIDKLLVAVLKRFLPSSSDRQTILQALIPARTACQLHYLTGASTVIYGMPVIAE